MYTFDRGVIELVTAEFGGDPAGAPGLMLIVLTLALAYTTSAPSNAYMNCGPATLCGVLVLETGFGDGYYRHDQPSVHGLWPEVGEYGTSKCMKPTRSSDDPSRVYSCYSGTGGNPDHQLSFETHEWEKHGSCAGVADASDYFNQICSLSEAPLEIMVATRRNGSHDLDDYAADLKAAGFPVFDASDKTNMQVSLSACAGADGKWKLASVEHFGNCTGVGPGPTPTPPAPKPTPSPPTGQCLPDQHGPKCETDAECQGSKGCVRCAHSGYCTSVPVDDN